MGAQYANFLWYKNPVEISASLKKRNKVTLELLTNRFDGIGNQQSWGIYRALGLFDFPSYL